MELPYIKIIQLQARFDFPRARIKRRKLKFSYSPNPGVLPKSYSPIQLQSISSASTVESSFAIPKHSVPPYVSAKSWAVYSSKGKLLYGKAPDQKREIASLTKIMTFYTALDLIDKYSVHWEQKVRISHNASNLIGTSANLQYGDQVSLIELLYGLMLPSGNDAALAIAEYLGCLLNPDSPYKAFINHMNTLAQSLGLKSTTFRNPHGLSISINTSTAFEVCKLASHAMKNPVFSRVVSTKEYTCKVYNPNSGYRNLTWKNTNKLLGEEFDGVKTGQTFRAGPCMCVRAKANTPFFVTVLASKSLEARWKEIPKLTAWVKTKLNGAA